MERQKKANKLPLFLGYLFVHIPNTYEEMLAVLKINGVVRFVGISQSQPEIVPEKQIISLKKLVESKEALDPYPYLKGGQRVCIKRGPLAAVQGILIKKKDSTDLFFLLTYLDKGYLEK